MSYAGSVPIARTAVQAIKDISRELKAIGSPANPALTKVLVNAFKVLDVGGTICGYYGSGKSLISAIYSIVYTGIDEQTLVIEANKCLINEGRVSISRISPIAEILNTLESRVGNSRVIDLLEPWINELLSRVGIKGRFSKDNCLNHLKKLRKLEVVIEGKGLQRILSITDYLISKGVRRIIIDEFERLLASLNSYGYKTTLDFIEDFFILTDSKHSNVSIAIPYRLRELVDVEIMSRLQPIEILAFTTDDMHKFFLNILNVYSSSDKVIKDVLNELSVLRINFKVPRSVVNLALEAISLGSLREVAIRRSSFILLASDAFIKGRRRKAIATILYLFLWLSQSIYEVITREKLNERLTVIKDLVASSTAPERIKEITLKYLEEGVKKIIEYARRGRLIRRIGDVYVITEELISSLINSVGSRYVSEVLQSKGVSFDPKNLVIEMQLPMGVTAW